MSRPATPGCASDARGADEPMRVPQQLRARRVALLQDVADDLPGRVVRAGKGLRGVRLGGQHRAEEREDDHRGREGTHAAASPRSLFTVC